MKSSFIRENDAFKDKDGNFDEQLFDNVYRDAV
nr:MAG TPA: hypothetical protein [Caudoviricetes sp.]